MRIPLRRSVATPALVAAALVASAFGVAGQATAAPDARSATPSAVTAAAANAPTTATTTNGTALGLTNPVDGHAQTCSGPAVVCRDRTLFGLATPGALALGPSLTGLEARIGHRSDLIGSYQDFTEPMYTSRLQAAIASGRTPVVTWEPFYAKKPTANTYPLASIAAGRYDTYLRRSALQAAAVGKPFIVRFGHEMNGFWYPWGQPRALHPQSLPSNAANTPAAYVAAYRHVVQVFRANGASNVSFMWSPNVTDANPSLTLKSLYPGDTYVDVIGLSGYLEKPTDTFEGRYRTTLDELAGIGGSKPIIVAETGAVASATRAPQLTAMLSAMTAEPRINGLIYFSQPDKSIDYRIDTDTDAQAAITSALEGPRFVGSTTAGSAFAVTPQITGAVAVGSTLNADLAWRGRPTRAVGSWLSCPAADTEVSGCTRVGWGSSITVGSDLHGRYLRAALGVTSATNSDYAVSRAVGPLLTVPDAVAPAGIDLLSGSVRLRMPSAPAGATNWVVRLDGAAPVYLPTATTEYYMNSLTAGTSHTVSLAATDSTSAGPPTTRTFGVVAKPTAPTASVSPGSFTATLPASAPGQTGWIVIVDGVETAMPLSTTTVTRTGLSPGGHSVGIKAVAGDGLTNAAFAYPQVP